MSSVFGQANPGAVSFGNTNNINYGLFFTLANDAPLTKIWFYSGSSEAGEDFPSECSIYASGSIVSGTHNTSPSWSGAMGSGWISVTYDGSVTLHAGILYTVTVFWGGNHGNSRSYKAGFSYPVTGSDGEVTAPLNNGAGLANAPFASGGNNPDTDAGGSYWWGIDVEVSGTVPAFSASYVSTDGNGIQTWNVTSSHNGGATPIATRVLPPSSPSPGRPHAFLWCLTVEPGQGNTYGDPLATILALGAHNTYNITCIELGYAISPWYGNNVSDASVSQETFILDAVTWAQGQFGSGAETHNLIGFSKSGIGGQGLILRNPTIFNKCASWDAPFSITDYDGTDPNYPSSPVGGGSAAVYGTSANFKNNYQLSSGNLTTWRDASNFATRKRLWIGGYNVFQGDVEAYHPLLLGLGIPHEYAEISASAHVWAPSLGWVAPALSWMFSSSGLLMASIILQEV